MGRGDKRNITLHFPMDRFLKLRTHLAKRGLTFQSWASSILLPAIDEIDSGIYDPEDVETHEPD